MGSDVKVLKEKELSPYIAISLTSRVTAYIVLFGGLVSWFKPWVREVCFLVQETWARAPSPLKKPFVQIEVGEIVKVNRDPCRKYIDYSPTMTRFWQPPSYGYSDTLVTAVTHWLFTNFTIEVWESLPHLDLGENDSKIAVMSSWWRKKPI